MKYAGQKINAIFLGSIFAIGGTVGVIHVLLNEPITTLLMPLPFALVGFYVLIFGLKRIAKFEKMSYEWYLSENPKDSKTKKLACNSCGSNRINVRALMQHTYTREHFCAECGKTLYYSPEQKS